MFVIIGDGGCDILFVGDRKRQDKRLLLGLPVPTFAADVAPWLTLQFECINVLR